jgi:hypothetical protein
MTVRCGLCDHPIVNIQAQDVSGTESTYLRAGNLNFQNVVAEHGQGHVIFGFAGPNSHGCVGLKRNDG